MPKVFINHVNSYIGCNIVQSFTNLDVFSLCDNKTGSCEELLKDSNNFIISGTFSHNYELPRVSSFLVSPFDDIILFDKILTQDIIIYNIVEDSSQICEAELVVRKLHQNLGNFHSTKLFILVSTSLTWANTRILDPEDPERSFIDEDYRMRRPHPSFKEHLALEKLVTKFGRSNKSLFSTYIVSTGLLYGKGECILHFLFRLAWIGGEDAQYLPIFGNGHNILPMIHIKDLTSILLLIIENLPKSRYIIAVDSGKNTLEEIIRTLSIEMGTGMIKNFIREDFFLVKGVDQFIYDSLSVNLRMDSAFVKGNMDINWVCESGFVDNISPIVAEYKKARNLTPIRLCIIGPPASGKTLLASYLARYYKIHHIQINEVIQEQILLLENLAKRIKSNGDDDAESRSEQAKELLEKLNENAMSNSGRYDDTYIVDFYRTKLSSKTCLNKGFILDGFPSTYNIAEKLFGSDCLDHGVTSDDNIKMSIIPSHAIFLEISEYSLKQRLIGLDQKEIEGTHVNEEVFVRRFEKYLNLNSTEPTVHSYFDENEIEIISIDVCNSPVDIIAGKIISLVGRPQNFGLSAEELKEIFLEEKEKHLLERKNITDCRIESEMNEIARVLSVDAQWTSQMFELRRQQKCLLENHALPLRTYVMKYVMPTLIHGLSDIVKIKPTNPIDYLAEFLFKTNPFLD